MAFSGVNIACTTIASRAGASLTGDVQWAENLTASPATTINKAPTDTVMFEVAAAVDSWVTFGMTPDDPSQAGSKRILVRAGETRNLFVQQGYKASVAAVA